MLFTMRKILLTILYFYVFTCINSISAQNHISDSIFAIGVSCYQKGEYYRAIKHFMQCDSIDMNDDNLSENRKVYSKMWIASSFLKLGQVEKAKKTSEEFYKFEPIDRRKTLISDSLSNHAILLFNEENYLESLETLIKCSKIEKNILGNYSLWYKNTIRKCGYLCYNMANYKDAIKYGRTVKEITKHIYGTLSKEHIETIHELIGYYGDSGDYNKTAKLLIELENIIDSIKYENEEDYVSAIIDIVNYYELLEDYNEAVRLLNKTRLKDDYNTASKAIKNYKLFENLSKLEKYEEAILVGKETLTTWSTKISSSDSTYCILGDITIELANCYSKIGDNLKSTQLCNSAIEIYKTSNLLYDVRMLQALNLLASCYCDLGLYEKAIEIEENATQLAKELFSSQSHEYALELSNLAYYWGNKGDKTKAFLLNEKAYNIARSLENNIEESDYLLILSNLASHYAELGNFDKAVELYKLILKKRGIIYGKENFEYATSLNNLASYLSHTETYNIKEVINIQEESLQILKKIFGCDNPYYIQSITNLAVLYGHNGNIKKELELHKYALSLMQKLCSNNHPSMIILYYNIANTFYELHKYESAIEYLEKAHSIINTHNLDESIEYVNIKIGLYNLNLKIQKIDEAKKWMKKICYSLNKQVTDNFPQLTLREREHFWNLFSEWFYEDLPQILLFDKTNETIDLIYNATLLSKGILLGTDIEINKLLNEEDSTMLTDLYKLRQYQLMLNNVSKSETKINIDSIISENESAERSLIRNSKIYRNLKNYYSINLHDIKKCLNNNELAIEFISVPSEKYTKYYALCIKEHYKVPHIIELFDSKQIESSFSNNIVPSSLSKLVWEPLKNELVNVDRIYFAPTGELHKIPIESAPIYDNANSVMTDKYDIHRLSSTRELVINRRSKTNNNISSIALYGGLTYNNSSDSVEFIHELSGTEQEIESIIRLLPTSVKDYTYNGNKGTKESFKKLSNLNISILHCATHSFYHDINRIKKTNIRFSKDIYKTHEDESLTYSGLYLSSTNVDNRQLTAYEISKLDFRGMQLAVLSACETGLGNITSEGVFGLQRGFKKAGVKTIIMSLWKVDDISTQLLMTEFYKNFFDGHEIYKSLQLAKSYLKNYKDENGIKLFESPYYWAGFVILD